MEPIYCLDDLFYFAYKDKSMQMLIMYSSAADGIRKIELFGLGLLYFA